MTTTILTSWRAFAFAFLIGAVANASLAQTPPAPQFQAATITGSGNTITATRVPVVLSASVIVYIDLTMQFNSDANGNLTLVAAPQTAPSPMLVTGNFTPGTYVGPPNLFNGKGMITVSGPSVSSGGSTTWSLTAAPGSDPTLYFTSANWYAGPIANNPFAARINAAKITSAAYSYGVATTINSAPNPWFSSTSGTLIGVTQTSPTMITIACFSLNGGNDQANQYANLTFTLQP